MANDNSCPARLASISSIRPSAQAGTPVPNKAGMPRKRRRPNTTKSPKKRRKQQASSDDSWCEIKGVLGEREVDGELQYLVEWEDHPTTGETYPYEWKIKADLSKGSIVQWEETKQQQRTDPQGTKQASQQGKISQEPRPACHKRPLLPLGKRPRPQLPESVTGDEDSEASRSRKRVRSSSEQSADSAPSFTTSTLTSGSEQPDSPPISERAFCQVVIDHKPEFDPSEYQSVSVQLSRSTTQHISSQSVSALESQDQNIVVSAGHSQGTIPDSQEPSSLETQQSRSAECYGSSPYLIIPDSLPRAVSGEGTLQESGSIPSHQPEHEFHSYSRIEMSTPRESHGSARFEGSDSAPRGEGSSSSHAANAFLTQPAQRNEGSEQISTATQFSITLQREKELIRQEQEALNNRSSDDEDEDDDENDDENDDEDDDEEEEEDDDRGSIERKDVYTAQPSLSGNSNVDVGIEPAQPQAEIPVLPSIDLSVSGNLMPALQSSTDSEPQDPPFRPSSPQTLTLPLLANRRFHYIKTMNDHHKVIDNWRISFLEFQEGKRESPDEELGTIIDAMFHRLQDLCDYGGCEPSEEPESLKDRVNWWSSANSKFNFLHELLKGLAGDHESSNTETFKVAIVADMEYLLPRLCEMAEFLGIAHTCKTLDRSYNVPEGMSTLTPRVHVTLAQTGEYMDVWDMDVVVAYGTGFSKSDLAEQLHVDVDTQERTRPLVLQLAIAMSLEHVEDEIFQLERGFDRSEHRYALLCSTIHHMAAIAHPPAFMDVEDEPQRLAGEICRYLLGAGFADIAISPWPLETSVEELLESSQLPQPEPGQDGGRKRPRAETQSEVEEAKRLRRDSRPDGSSRSIPLPQDLREFLEESGWRGILAGDEPQPRITLPLSILQDVRARFLDSKRVALDYEKEIALQRELIESAARPREEEQAFYDRASEELRRALSDRSAAEEAAKTAQASFAKKELDLAKEKEKLESKIQAIEGDNARLRSSTATTDSENQLNEAQQEIKRLKSRFETSQSTEAYIRDQYHKMSSEVGETRALQEQVETLRKQAEERTIETQRINNEHSSKSLLGRIAELEAMEHYYKTEMTRLHEDNRNLKNALSNRRETRQGSQPRSPRPGLMSPRPRGQLSSREASPVMGGMFPAMNNGGGTGMQYTSQNGPGGVRWGHGQVP